MFISCQLLPLLQMFISLQLLPSFQYFTLIRLRNNIKKCVGQVRVTLPQYDCNRSRRRHINSPTTNSPTTNSPTLLLTNQDVGEVTEDAIEVTGMSVSWPSTTVGKLTKDICELTCHRSDRVPEVLTCVAIQISNVSLVLLPDPRKEFCSLDTPHRLFLLQTFPLSTKGWTKYNIKFRKINRKDEKSWAWKWNGERRFQPCHERGTKGKI